MSNTSSTYNWDDVDLDEDVFMEEDDFFVSLDEEDHSSHLPSLDLTEDSSRSYDHQYSSLYRPPQMPQRYQSTQSPEPHRFSERPSTITPESSQDRTRDLTELQREYQRSLKKLAKSMRHTDTTRNILKRQLGGVGRTVSNDQDFFSSPRMQQVEASRRQVFRTISG